MPVGGRDQGVGGILTGLLDRWYETIAAAVVVLVCTIIVARREE